VKVASSINEEEQSQDPFIPGSFYYYLSLAERRLATQSSEKGAESQTNRRPPAIEPNELREVISRRSSNQSNGDVLRVFGMDKWSAICRTYHEEIGMQYPFLDIEILTARFRTARENLCHDDPRIEDIACLILGIVSCLGSMNLVDAVSPLVQDIFGAAIVRVHTDVTVDKSDMESLILASMFLFLCDREVQAWRCTSTVMRLVHEKCHNEPQSRGSLGTLYWTVYTLDRRWSFGTGLPFAVSDADIANTQQPSLQEQKNLSLAYLKQMVSYCGIASEVRRTLPSQRASSAGRAQNDYDTARDFVHFRVIQWQKNLPQKLQFTGVGDKFDPARERRGEYKLRLMLYLRANQMRNIILRKAATIPMFSDAVFSTTSASCLNNLEEVARDTIHVLVYLSEETDIYHAQHRTFNHFLEAALTSLLLVASYDCAGEGRASAILGDIMAAVDLVKQLSKESRISGRLHEKFKAMEPLLQHMHAASVQSTARVSSSREASVQLADHNAYSSSSFSGAISNATLSEQNPSRDQQLGIRCRETVAPYLAPGSHQGRSVSLITTNNTPSEQLTTPLNVLGVPEDSLLSGALDSGDVPEELHKMTDLSEHWFENLSDILLNYDHFAF
jgi:hypothetical protein